MKVLVIGSGGREHALCHGLKRSPRLSRLFIMPGNAGTARLGTNVPGNPLDFPAVIEFAQRERIDLVVVGPEDPLAAGITDALTAAGLRVFGPTAAAAQIEADKAFAKQLMREFTVPTADARSFTNYEDAKHFISTRDEPVVVKAAGLAKGKGVIVCDDPADAIIAAEDMLVHHKFGDAGRRIIVEERLLGREASVLAIVSGRTCYVLEPAQDHKRLGDGDTGPNTGGMGAYCPTPALDEPLLRRVDDEILVPMLDAFVQHEIEYSGVLYIGLMLTAAGPKVLEFNCRFGDPETQAILPRMRSDLLELLDAATGGTLEDVTVEWDPRAALCVVMASAGYPESVKKGVPITNLPGDMADAFVFHAGTKLVDGKVVTDGGRVLGVTALGADLAAARTRAYEVVEQIRFDGAQYRTDLGSTV